MTYYQRNLPHWFPEGRSVFLTWRLHGSLPRTLRPCGEQTGTISEGKRFALWDRALGVGDRGPLWLRDPSIAQLVLSAIEQGESRLGLYALEAYVVMPNHVHVLLNPNGPVAEITRHLKGQTARSANRILSRSGERFWQDESFDHWVRDEVERRRLRCYIEKNPVAAGLAKRPENWPWSSASRKFTQAGGFGMEMHTG
ncbi:MAG: transposase [Candidatus Acidiferrales bacterium]